MVVALVALVVALGGTAVAATKVIITKSAQVKNGSLRGVDLANGTIGARKLTAAATASLRGQAGAPGSPGAPAPRARRASPARRARQAPPARS